MELVGTHITATITIAATKCLRLNRPKYILLPVYFMRSQSARWLLLIPSLQTADRSCSVITIVSASVAAPHNESGRQNSTRQIHAPPRTSRRLRGHPYSLVARPIRQRSFVRRKQSCRLKRRRCGLASPADGSNCVSPIRSSPVWHHRRSLSGSDPRRLHRRAPKSH